MSIEVLKPTHSIYLADDTGIASIYPALRSGLYGENGHISLIYYSESGLFHFKKEVEILSKAYPTILFVTFAHADFSEFGHFTGEEIEALINANTLPKIRFIISGRAEFRYNIEERLHFLGEHDITIQEQFFS